jgi:hypothetical protein
MNVPPEFARELRDKKLYVCRPGRAVFDEHSEPYWAKGGRTVPKGTPGAHRALRRFGKVELEEIAQRTNARARRGDPSAITIGHTDPEEPDEAKQPPIVGYAVDYRVDYDRERQKWMLYADYYIRRDHYAHATTFPRTSIELWPADKVIDPVAVLRRTPSRDLGQWIFRRGGRCVLRYAMETSPMTDEPLDEAPEEALPPAGGGGTMPQHEVEQFERHMTSHPLYAKYHHHMSQKYAREEEPGEEDVPAEEPPLPPPGPGGAEPTDFPTADEEGAPGQYGAYPSSTNSLFPARQQHARGGRRRQQPASSQDRIRVLETKLAETEARAIVDRLDSQGYFRSDEEMEREVLRFARLSEAGRRDREQEIRDHWHPAPTGGTPLPPPERASGGMIDPNNLEGCLSPADQEKVYQYSRRTGEYDVLKAARAVFPQRFARNGNGPNGR